MAQVLTLRSPSRASGVGAGGLHVRRPRVGGTEVGGRFCAGLRDASGAASSDVFGDVLDRAGTAAIPLAKRPGGVAVLPKSLSPDSLES